MKKILVMLGLLAASFAIAAVLGYVTHLLTSDWPKPSNQLIGETTTQTIAVVFFTILACLFGFFGMLICAENHGHNMQSHDMQSYGMGILTLSFAIVGYVLTLSNAWLEATPAQPSGHNTNIIVVVQSLLSESRSSEIQVLQVCLGILTVLGLFASWLIVQGFEHRTLNLTRVAIRRAMRAYITQQKKVAKQ